MRASALDAARAGDGAPPGVDGGCGTDHPCAACGDGELDPSAGEVCDDGELDPSAGEVCDDGVNDGRCQG